MTRPIITITDAVTKEQVIREMNDQEFAQYELDKAAWEAEQAEEPTE